MRRKPKPVTNDEAHDVVRLLHRYGLLTHERKAAPRSVRIHALTAQAARESTPAGQHAAAVRAAADALLHEWPQSDHTDRELAAVLRVNIDVLRPYGGDALWWPNGHPVLYRAGRSLLDAGLYNAAVTHWADLAANATRILGDDHSGTLTARANLARSYGQAGRTADAITIQEQVLADAARVLGPDHHGTLTARANLAASFGQAGRTAEAITIQEQVLTDAERALGVDHPDSLTTRAHLASSYRQAGRTTEAITIQEQVLADTARVLGPDHPDTLTARANLAAFYRQSGRTTDAITILETVVSDRERVLGADHPDTQAVETALRDWLSVQSEDGGDS